MVCKEKKKKQKQQVLKFNRYISLAITHSACCHWLELIVAAPTGQQLRAVHHQLLQREAAADLHRADAARGAGGVRKRGTFVCSQSHMQLALNPCAHEQTGSGHMDKLPIKPSLNPWKHSLTCNCTSTSFNMSALNLFRWQLIVAGPLRHFPNLVMSLICLTSCAVSTYILALDPSALIYAFSPVSVVHHTLSLFCLCGVSGTDVIPHSSK